MVDEKIQSDKIAYGKITDLANFPVCQTFRSVKKLPMANLPLTNLPTFPSDIMDFIA